MSRCRSLPLVILILCAAAAQPAEAYIDPGNTSMVLQFVVGGIAAIAVLGRRLWLSTVQRLTGTRRDESRSSSDPQSTRPLGR